MRALFVSAGNPVLSVPDGEELDGGDRRARPLRRDRHLHVARPPSTPTTCCRRRRSSSARTSRSRSSALFTKPFINMTEAVVEPSRRGAPGVGDHRGHRRAGSASCPRASSRSAARQGRDQALAAPARRHAAAHRPAGRPLRPAPRRAQPRSACARSRTGSSSPSTSRPGVLARQDPPRGRAGPALPARDRGRGRCARRGGGRRRRRVPAADDRAARAALAQLLDAQLAEADGRRPRPSRPDPPRRRARPPGSPTASGCGSPPPTARSRPSRCSATR